MIRPTICKLVAMISDKLAHIKGVWRDDLGQCQWYTHSCTNGRKQDLSIGYTNQLTIITQELDSVSNIYGTVKYAQ